MKIDKETVRKIAHLSRLELSADQEENMISKLSEILEWVEKLNELDTDGIDPLINISQEVNRWREDETQIEITHEEALKNAPKHDEDFFIVPKVVE
ncbi:Asp-tRNA(Asn)/Glu-tRNA(Gln) amidotransferase subunit GatC [Marinigracilibium pacificum]|uniref:Aspartyl/glutamyl-tRNA(Asn/Gln) amidotransferase subunit C n=1 Tax=Marinigracilibium pacificum TaxID=2729599 RepID=A0A848IZJ1_9BACT|nr:Asp-tRNA(Asn)/Glu-tRNA(Gln) amidotransferase subunit GatC [Marinigracilibium pacificum]NMM48791.1 Asp-tRNA(Asn)/Glu-tRNA(Gln) amidotransferase subunit GatC [Marinigracilibium pacificum]